MKKDVFSPQLSGGLAATTLAFAVSLACIWAGVDLWRAEHADHAAVLGQFLDRLFFSLCVSVFAMVLVERRLLRHLRQSQARLTAVFQASPIGISVTNLKTQEVLEVNQSVLNLLGYRRDEVVGKSVGALSVFVRPQQLRMAVRVMRELGKVQSFALEFRRRNGEIGTAELSGSLIDIAGEQHVVAMWIDVTERLRTENQLRKLSQAVEQSPVSIVITNTSAEIEYVNQAFFNNTGYSASEVLGQNPRLLKSGKTPPETYDDLWSTLSRGETWKGELYNKHKNGSHVLHLAVISPILQADGKVSHYLSVQDDITTRKAATERIHTLAYYDQLTGLPNRRLLIEQLQRAVQTCAEGEQSAALLYIDLDNFKTLNETMGHDMGDMLLQQVARRLRACVRSGDTVARLGGDEFVLLVHDLGDMPIKVASRIQVLGDKVLASLNRNYQLEDHVHHSTPSIGVALIGQGHQTVEDILRHADLAMYEAKAAGRNTLRFFDPKMQAEVAVRAQLEEDLRRALAGGQFQLHYQAQVQEQGQITGAEVLLRWPHPERGMVPPMQFISVAEDNGLILPLGQWVLDTACEQLAHWAADPQFASLTLAVNVSSRQFQAPGFVDAVRTTIVRTGANPNRLKLELTESLLVQDVEDVIAKMTVLQALGISFSLDDFGTGYSSLSYLKRLPLNQLKIDQGFVRDILSDPNDAAIAKMVMALADTMGLSVIAEGVETQEQRSYLASLGCRTYQGYLFSRPLVLPAFEELVREQGRAS